MLYESMHAAVMNAFNNAPVMECIGKKNVKCNKKQKIPNASV